MSRFDNELKELERVVKEKKQAIADADLELKQLEHDLQTLAKEKTAATNFITNLEKQYEWIVEEHEYVEVTVRWDIDSDRQNRSFGKTGSQYDFTGVDVNRLREKAKEIEAQQKGLKKKINPKVINMIDT